MKRNRLPYPLLVVVFLMATCGDDDPSGPSPEEIAGSYEATALLFSDGEDQRNLLQEGAFVDITMHADGTTEGDLFIPALTGGAPLQADLAGTWEVERDLVTFHPDAGTLLSDAPFLWGGDGVLGTRFYTEDGVLDLTLTRTGPAVVE